MKLVIFLIASLAWAQDQPTTLGDLVCHDPNGCLMTRLDKLQAENNLLRAQLEQTQLVCNSPDVILAWAKTIQAQRALDATKQPKPKE